MQNYYLFFVPLFSEFYENVVMDGITDPILKTIKLIQLILISNYDANKLIIYDKVHWEKKYSAFN